MAFLAAAVPIISGLATAAGAVGGLIQAFKGPQMPSQPKIKNMPVAGESTKLSPGQKTNLINTSPQGVLSGADTYRSTLLGG